ncbi:MAG: hypothetical protein Cons2KO_13490 [Congregibacter sp.]
MSADFSTPESRASAARTDSRFHLELRSVTDSLCESYALERRRIWLREKSGREGGLGNAIPLPFPFCRRYIVRYHRYMRHANALELRGLFAHELMHVQHYARASYFDLQGFMLRYALFGVTEGLADGIGRDWVRSLEHLTDLMAIHRGEGAAIAAWKRFKNQLIADGLLADSWADMYITDAEVEALIEDPDALRRCIESCLVVLRARHPLQPFRRDAA